MASPDLKEAPEAFTDAAVGGDWSVQEPAWTKPRKVVGLAAVVASTCLLLLTIPPVVPTTETGSVVVAGAGTYCPAIHPSDGLELPLGRTVRVSWSAENGTALGFGVKTLNGTAWTCRWVNVSAGSCTFVAGGGTYSFVAFAPRPPTQAAYVVSYSVTYYSPVL